MIRRALPPCINGENFTFNVAGSRFILQRPLSTNSAIHRGIRKSNSRGRDDLSSRSWGHGSTKNVDEQRYSGRREPRFDKRDVQHTGGFGNSREDRRESWQRGNLEGEPRNPKKQWNNDRTKPGYNTFKSREDFPREQVRSPRQYTADFALSDPGNKGYSSQDQRGFSAQHEARRLRTSERIDRRDLSNGKRYAPDRCENSPSASSASISPGLPTRAERRAALYGPGDTLPGGIPRAQEEQAEYRKPLSSAPREMRDSPPHRQVNPLGDKDPDDERRHFPVRRREGSFGDGSLEDGRRPAISRASSGSDNWKPWEGKSHAPLSIPYTTPASEFLYGTSVIKAALHAQRRQMYKLYIYHGDNREIRPQEQTIRKLALARGVNVVQVQGDWLRLMDKMCMGRPHNGYILEASPLPKLPVAGLQPLPEPDTVFQVSLDHQSKEEEAVNGKDSSIKYQGTFPRFPFILLVDGILDPGNLGAIIRTAFFLGVDALAISTRNSAPLSSVALKASAGSCESLPILSLAHPANFIEDAQRNGWKFCAAVAPLTPANMPIYPRRKQPTYYSTSTLGCPTQDHPCVLMLGSEGEGLRWTLQKKADYVLGVQGARLGQGGVDSLNVSVAAGLLCEAFMKPPSTSQPAYKEIRENEDVTSNVTVDAAHSSSHDETRGGYVKPTMGAQLGKGEDGEKNENVLF